ncbi:hypothetical protein [Streptomyces sp. NPDC058045]|uniref:hypothetical protein n=1 Tax=Streptomyces sp. NPDC058045 TaxID=3346311 RepID=UPI0036E1F924
MISTRRVLAALALATGATGLAVPAAVAADQGVQVPSVLGTVDDLSANSVSAEHRDELPRPTEQLSTASAGLNHGVSELAPLTGQVAPVTGLLPAVQ